MPMNIANTTITYPVSLTYTRGACVSGGHRNFYGANLDANRAHIHAGYWQNTGILVGSANAPATSIFAMIFGFI